MRLGSLLAVEHGELVARRSSVALLTLENGEPTLAQLKVATEVAAQEFSRMCATYRIDEDESGLGKAALKEWRGMRDPIVRDICRGALAIDAEGYAVWTTESGKAHRFNRPTTATFITLETHGEGKNISNMSAAICEMTGLGPGEFAKLFAPDFQGMSRLARLFLADR